jgi:predicted enzyme related to lactoylglutathione lyase
LLVSVEWEQVVVDARDPVALGHWWADVLGWAILNDSPEEFEIRPAANQLPGVVFVPVPEAKESKNRLHLDFRPGDQQAEVERFLRAGARRVDIGQEASPWVVLADPEGNEFCVLSARKS